MLRIVNSPAGGLHAEQKSCNRESFYWKLAVLQGRATHCPAITVWWHRSVCWFPWSLRAWEMVGIFWRACLDFTWMHTSCAHEGGDTLPVPRRGTWSVNRRPSPSTAGLLPLGLTLCWVLFGIQRNMWFTILGWFLPYQYESICVILAFEELSPVGERLPPQM